MYWFTKICTESQLGSDVSDAYVALIVLDPLRPLAIMVLGTNHGPWEIILSILAWNLFRSSKFELEAELQSSNPYVQTVLKITF